MRRPQVSSVWMFFGLVFAISIPFWVAGALNTRPLLPGVPFSALGFICPMLAAAWLVYRKDGAAGVFALLKRSFDVQRIPVKAWLAPLLLVMPAIMLVSFLVIRWTGVAIPVPQFTPVQAIGLLIGFFIAALGEELGWMGYAVDPLQERYGALPASLVIGAVWTIWHIIPLLEVGRSWTFMGWWSLGTVAFRVLIVWLYNNMGGSVFVAVVFHAMINLTWQLFPVNGSFYDPRITGLITALVALSVVIIWGPNRLTRQKVPA